MWPPYALCTAVVHLRLMEITRASDSQHPRHFQQRQLILDLFLIDFLCLDLFCPRFALLGLDLEIKQAMEVFYVVLC